MDPRLLRIYESPDVDFSASRTDIELLVQKRRRLLRGVSSTVPEDPRRSTSCVDRNEAITRPLTELRQAIGEMELMLQCIDLMDQDRLAMQRFKSAPEFKEPTGDPIPRPMTRLTAAPGLRCPPSPFPAPIHEWTEQRKDAGVRVDMLLCGGCRIGVVYQNDI